MDEKDFDKEDYKYIASFNYENSYYEAKALTRFLLKHNIKMIKGDMKTDKILIFY